MDHVKDVRRMNAEGLKRIAKWGVTAVPAGIITFSLFVAMTQAIGVDDLEPADPPIYDLEAYVETPKITETRPSTTKPTRQDALDLPPIPKPISHKLDVQLEPVDYTPMAEATYQVPGLNELLPKTAALHMDGGIRPIQHPIPTYPSKAARDGLEGWCEVSLSVSSRGDPFNVEADCSHRVFESAAERAVKKSKFTPKIVDGKPVTVVGVVYPLEFRLE